MVAFRRAVSAVLLVAVVTTVLAACGVPAAGDPCSQATLWHTTTLDSGDVLECRPVGGQEGPPVWTLVGHDETSGSLVGLGWLAAIVGATALTVGGVGILYSRSGRRRQV